jgi:hypothetical protein
MSIRRNIQRFRGLTGFALAFMPVSVPYLNGGGGPVPPAPTGHPAIAFVVVAVVAVAVAAVLAGTLTRLVVLARRRRAAVTPAAVEPYPASDETTAADRDTAG